MKLLLCLIFSLLFSNIFCQYDLKNWNTENSPLTNNSINVIEVDFEGMLWIGTNGGVFKFDYINDEWSSFNVSNSNISSNHIRSITFDKNNNLWVGSFNDGLFFYNGLEWVNYNIENSPLPDNFVKSLQFDLNENLWISTSGGFVKKNGDNWKIWNLDNYPLLWSQNFSDIIVDSTNNNKYVGSMNGGLNIYKNDSLYDTEVTFTHSIIDNTISKMAFKNNKIYATSPAGGLMYRTENGVWGNFNQTNSSLPTSSFLDLEITNKIYLASQDNGVIIFDSESDSCYSINELNSNLETNEVPTIKFNLSDQSLWIGTFSNGLFKLEKDDLNTDEYDFISALIYPNPASNFLNIRIASPPSNLFFELYDTFGNIKIDYEILSSFETIDILSLKPSVYFYKIILGKSTIINGKIVIK